jgi:uncharacterized membrane protein
MEPTTPPPAPTDNQQTEDLSLILKIVSFCIPLVGAILWFINKDKNPKAAKSACTFALVNVLVTVLGN